MAKGPAHPCQLHADNPMLTILLSRYQAYKQAITKEQDTAKRERAESMAGGGGGYDDVSWLVGWLVGWLGVRRDWKGGYILSLLTVSWQFWIFILSLLADCVVARGPPFTLALPCCCSRTHDRVIVFPRPRRTSRCWTTAIVSSRCWRQRSTSRRRRFTSASRACVSLSRRCT